MLGLSGTSFGECFHCLSQLLWLESGLGALGLGRLFARPSDACGLRAMYGHLTSLL